MESEKDNSKVVCLYDDICFSNEKVVSLLNAIFEAIDNNKKGLKYKHDKEKIEIAIENKYYTCTIGIDVIALSGIKEIHWSDYEGIMVLLAKDSITQRIFEKMVSSSLPEDGQLSSCIAMFEENRDDLCEMKEYEAFIGETIDRHFEIICDCGNMNNYNDDDGIGSINTSLQNVHWEAAVSVNDKVKKPVNAMTNEQKILEGIQGKGKEEGSAEDKRKMEAKKEGYEELKDQNEYEDLLMKLKDLKEINQKGSINDQERRDNAEKAMLLMAKMMGLDDELDEEDITNDESKKD